MKKTAFLLAAVMSLSAFGASLFTAHAENVTEDIFFTDFDSYKIGNAETVNTPFTGSLNDGEYGLIQPNQKNETVKKSMKAASNIGNMNGTCMEFAKGQNWQNIQIPLNLQEGMTGKVLMSFDFFTLNPWGRAQIITDLSCSQISGCDVQLIEKNENYKKTISTNKWHNIAVYVDTEAGRYSVFADGVKIGSANTTSTNGKLKYFKLQVLDGATNRYIDNVYIRKVDAEPEQSIYSTDFDSYRVNLGAAVQSSMLGKDLSAIYGTEQAHITHAYNVDGSAMTGAVKDNNYGTSLRFDTGDWRSANVVLPQTDNIPMMVSFDFNMAQQGTMKVIGNDASNYGAVFKGTTLETKLDNTSTDTENVIQVGKWAHVDIYVDNPNSKYIMYVDGEQIGGENAFGTTGNKLEMLNFQKVSGGVMFIDNLSVRYAETKLNWKENDAALSAVYSAPESVTVYAAEYDKEGKLLGISVENGLSGEVTLDKKEGAVSYKAFMWDGNNVSLCGALEK